MVEVGAVWAAVVLGLAFVYRTGTNWLGPVLLVLGTIVPSIIAHRPMPRFVKRDQIFSDLRAVLTWGLGLLVLGWIGGRLIRPWLMPAQARPEHIPAWVLWQCLAVAPAEELFFRGYIQSQLARQMHNWAMLGSSVLFACGHVVVLGQPVYVLTFLPGLAMGWLYAKTGRLLAPITFHGLANLIWGLF